MIRAMFALALAPLLAPSAPIAAQSAPAPTPTATPAPADKLICRASDTVGSRLQRKRVCMTAAQWRTNARNEADDLDRRLRAPHVEASGG